MEWTHLFHNDHGEWSILLYVFTGTALLADVARSFWRGLRRGFDRGLPRRYLVKHQKVTPPFFTPKVTVLTYGPYRTWLSAWFVMHLVCGPWDMVVVTDLQARP